MFCRNNVTWLYRAEENFSWESGYEIPEDRVFLDAAGKVRLIVEKGGRITVMSGYAWNGCSPKFCFLDLLFGTPDGVVHADTGRPKTFYASMVHDALYQFLKADSPLDRQQADETFLRLMVESEFIWSRVYWLAVRLIGRLLWEGKSRQRQWRGRGVTCAALLESRKDRTQENQP